MILLVLERSTARPSAAIFVHCECVVHLAPGERPSGDAGWVCDLNDRMHAAGLCAADLTHIAVGLGPGSFAGIRTALSLAQGLALPGNTPVLGFNSAAALARAEAMDPGDGPSVAVVGDARRGQLWLYRHTPERTPKHDRTDLTLHRWETLAPAIQSGDRVVTSEWDRLGEQIERTVPGFHGPRAAVYPDARTAAAWAVERPDDFCRAPHPLYPHPAV